MTKFKSLKVNSDEGNISCGIRRIIMFIQFRQILLAINFYLRPFDHQ